MAPEHGGLFLPGEIRFLGFPTFFGFHVSFLGGMHDDISVSVLFEFLLSAGMKDKMVGLRKNGFPLLNFLEWLLLQRVCFASFS